jgi:hypothetical protein
MYGEKKLLIRILAQAVLDALQLPSTLERHYVREARVWLCLDKKEPTVETIRSDLGFSFFDVCYYLDMCPYLIHKNIRQIMERADRDFKNIKARRSIIEIIPDSENFY